MPSLGQAPGASPEAQVGEARSELMFRSGGQEKPRNQPGQVTTDSSQCSEAVGVGEGAESCVTWGQLGEETCWGTAAVLGWKRERDEGHVAGEGRGRHWKGRWERVLGAS